MKSGRHQRLIKGTHLMWLVRCEQSRERWDICSVGGPQYHPRLFLYTRTLWSNRAFRVLQRIHLLGPSPPDGPEIELRHSYSTDVDLRPLHISGTTNWAVTSESWHRRFETLTRKMASELRAHIGCWRKCEYEDTVLFDLLTEPTITPAWWIS